MKKLITLFAIIFAVNISFGQKYDSFGEKIKPSGAIPTAELAKKASEKGERIFMALVLPVKDKEVKQLSPDIEAVLTEFSDILTDELPHGLPPSREVDHKIELIEGATPPVSRVYKMSYTELDELKRQLTELIDAGHIEPS